MSDVSQIYASEFSEFSGLRPPGASVVAADANAFIQRMPGLEFCNLVHTTVMRNADRELGFRFGAAIGGRGFGLLGIATAAAPSVLHSLQSLVRWEPLCSTLGRTVLYRRAGQVRIVWTPEHAVPAAVIEGILSGWVAFGRFLLGETVPVTALEMTHTAAAHRGKAEAILGCPVIFNAEENAVVIPAALLDARPRYADPALHARLAGWLDDCVRVIGQQHESPLRRAGSIILQGLAWGETAEDRIAAQLGLARRTLQRHLAAGGFNFRRLRELLRASLALCQLSAGGNRFIDIAQGIGYEEQATFSRAVRQWTGRSPREFSRLFADDYSRLRRVVER